MSCRRPPSPPTLGGELLRDTTERRSERCASRAAHAWVLLVTLTLGALSCSAQGSGVMRSAVGTGMQGYAGDGGPAEKALLNQPFHCSKDRQGNLYVADTFNHCIRKVDAKTGRISTVAGNGQKGYTGDGGPAVQATLNEPYGVLPDRDGNLFIVDRLNCCIRRVDAKSGVITTYAGNGQKGYGGDGGPAAQAMMREPNALDFDPAGNLYIADVTDNRIRRVDVKTGVISTASGTGKREFTGDGGAAAAAGIQGARAVAFDREGAMYICEREGNRIRKADAKTGVITTVAGTGQKGYTGDGAPALQATFNGPMWIHIGADGKVYVVDTENHCVRQIDPKGGTIRTVAGGHKGPDGDGGPADKAGMDRPHGCWVDADGRLYTGDTNNHRIRVNQLR
jgi:sugar lactone lactonase YvrE